MILFVKHIAIEGPDMIEGFFRSNGFKARTVELQDGESLPDDLSGVNAVVSLGGPMNVYEEEKYPFLSHENLFIKQVLDKQIPFMGICLGSQLLAKACGAKVGKSPGKEIGLFAVSMAAEGLSDPLFKDLADNLDAFQWHEDMSELPAGATLLASSALCPHQAFRVGTNAYGLQFHFEVTEPTVHKWIDAYFSKNDRAHMQQKKTIIEDYQRNRAHLQKTCATVCQNFLTVIDRYKNSSLI